MQKTLFLAVALLVFSAGASALTVDAPVSVPEHTSWGFSVALDPTASWSKVSVAVDGTHLLDAYSNGAITPDPYNGGFVLKSFIYSPDSNSADLLTLYVSHFGLAKGAHTVSAQSEGASDSGTVVAFAPLDESDRNSLESDINALNEKTAGEED